MYRFIQKLFCFIRNQGPMPIGLVSNLKLSQQPTTMTLLFPKDHLASDLEYREVHQVFGYYFKVLCN